MLNQSCICWTSSTWWWCTVHLNTWSSISMGFISTDSNNPCIKNIRKKYRKFQKAKLESSGHQQHFFFFFNLVHCCRLLFFFCSFFFFSFIYISWRLITLQYCSGFAIHWHESAMDLHVLPILNPPPTSLPIPSLRVIPVHQPRALVSCIQPGLAIYFAIDNIHGSMLFSQINPPSPSPAESKSLFYTSVSLFLSQRLFT